MKKIALFYLIVFLKSIAAKPNRAALNGSHCFDLETDKLKYACIVDDIQVNIFNLTQIGNCEQCDDVVIKCFYSFSVYLNRYSSINEIVNLIRLLNTNSEYKRYQIFGLEYKLNNQISSKSNRNQIFLFNYLSFIVILLVKNLYLK